MKAIETKFIGPSNVRGSRYKASAEGVKSITLNSQMDLNSEQNHDRAALALANKYGWLSGKHRVLARGGKPDGRGNVYVFVDKYTILRAPKGTGVGRSR